MNIDDILKYTRRLYFLAWLMSAFVIVLLLAKSGVIDLNYKMETAAEEVVTETVVDTSLFGSVDDESGLIIDHGFEVVRGQCGGCHSTKLVAQNGLSRDGWKDLITWMQEEQNLWDLGEQEGLILDYLAKNYGPRKIGRRKRIVVEEWYELAD